LATVAAEVLHEPVDAPLQARPVLGHLVDKVRAGDTIMLTSIFVDCSGRLVLPMELFIAILETGAGIASLEEPEINRFFELVAADGKLRAMLGANCASF
jgi:hypothetical protein